MKFKEVKNYEDICAINGDEPTKLPDVTAYDDEDKEAAVSEFKLWKIVKAAWKAAGIKQDWTRGTSQRKWFGWFWMADRSGSGGGFSCSVYDCDYDFSSVGARRVFPSMEDLEHAVATFPEIFKSTMTIPEEK